MKLFTFLSLFLLDTLSLFSQSDTLVHLSPKQEYLAKSNQQRSIGFVMLAVGTTSIVTGSIIAGNAKNKYPFPLPPTDSRTYDGTLLIIIGGVIDLLSIPFFVSASNNREKSKMSLSFINEPLPRRQIIGLKQNSFPALSLKFGL
jgi:hypothetical protein